MGRQRKQRRRCIFECLEDRRLLTSDVELQPEPLPAAETRDAAASRPEPRIVGGNETVPGRWPWMASVQDEDFGHFCGGSLITPAVVVTAAHCVFDFFGELTDPESLRVVLGRHDLSTDAGEELRVSSIVAHPNYDPFTLDSDIAVLLLSASSQQQPIGYVSPADEPLFVPGTLATAVGWGETEVDPAPDRLREVTVPIVSNQVANQPQSYAGQVSDNMLAAGLPEGGVDSCFGDSGGPLMVANGPGGHTLAGIVSWGLGCGQPDFYGIYTRVSAFSSWLDTFAGRADDAFEPNNTSASAFDLLTGDQLHEGLTIHHADGDDWYRWTALESGQLDVDVAFRHAQGDLDLQIYDSNGKFLSQSTTVTDDEHVTVEVVAGQEYSLRVFGLRSAVSVEYSLSIDGPGMALTDVFEPNDSPSQAPALFFAPFSTLSLHEPDDEDWFRISALQAGTLQVDLSFAHALGNVELEVYDSTGLELLTSSLTETDDERVSLEVVAGDQYLVRVFGADSATHPGYQLDFFIETAQDRFEPNNEQSQAFDLVTGDVIFDDLSIHVDEDEDWFQWTSPLGGVMSVRISSDDFFSDLDLELYDSDGDFLDASTGLDSNETITYLTERGETVLIRVVSFFGPVSSYSLQIDGRGSVPRDDLEPNNDPEDASPIAGLQGLAEDLSLHRGRRRGLVCLASCGRRRIFGSD